MTHNLKMKMIYGLVGAFIIYFGVGAYAFINMASFFKLDAGELMYNKGRVLTNGIVLEIEKNYTDLVNDREGENVRESILVKLEELDGRLEIIGLDGRVYFHWEDEEIYEKGVFRNLRNYINYDLSYSLQNEQYIKFSFPIIPDERQEAIAVFQLPEELFSKGTAEKDLINTVVPMFIIFAVSFFSIAFFYIKIIRGVLNPVEKISKSVEEISRGNLDKTIYIKEGTEIDGFCRDFDFMRQELKDAKTRQKELEDSHKELIASISHELRTPVTCIKANVEGILDGIVKNEEMMERYLKGIKDRSDSLSILIDDLLTHSMQQLKKLKIEKQEIYSKELLDKINHELLSRFENTEINFQVNGEVPDVLINVDKGRIEQIILNLVQNAEKYTPHNGTITLSYSLDDTHIWISVKDNGYGIAPEELPFIFEKFYRGEKLKEKEIQGSGLGLSICKYIIEQHGGAIKAESTENVGSEFIFSIPIV